MITKKNLSVPNPEVTNLHCREKSNRYVVTQDDDGYVQYVKRKLWQCSVRRNMFDLGVAPSLYFYMYISLAICMLVMALFAIPQIVFCSYGNMITSAIQHRLTGRTMLANLGIMPDIDNLDNTDRILAIEDRDIIIGNNVIDIHVITTVFSVLDAFAVSIFLLGSYILYRWTIPSFVRRYDRNTMRITDHSLALLNLPSIQVMKIHPSQYASVLTDHFVAMCNENPTFVGKDRTKDDIIQDIVIVRNYEGNFGNMYKLAKLREKEILEDIRIERGHKPGFMNNLKNCFSGDYSTKKAALTEKILQHYAPAHEADVIMAYITFKRSDDKNFIENLYSRYNSSLTYAYQPVHVRLLKLHRFRVVFAPEPEDVLWENLDYPLFKKKVWIVVVWLASVTLIVLFGVFRWLLYAPSNDLKAAPNVPTSADYALLEVKGSQQMDICDIQFYSDHTCSKPITQTSQVPYWNENKHRLTATAKQWDSRIEYCAGQQGQFVVDNGESKSGVIVGFSEFSSPKCVKFIHKNGENEVTAVGVSLCAIAGTSAMSDTPIGEYDNFICTSMLHSKTLPQPASKWVQLNLADFYRYPTSRCADTDAEYAEIAQMDSFIGQYPDLVPVEDTPVPDETSVNDWYSYCYCDSHLVEGLNWDRCTDINIDRVASFFITGAISMLVHISNSLIKKVIRKLTVRERHRCNSDRLHSNFIKIFLALFANAALVDFIINTRYTHYSGNNNFYSEINPGWYLGVGEQVTTTAFTYIILPHFLKLFKVPYWYFCKTRQSKEEKCVTQYDADNLKEPMEFKIDVKLASTLSFIGFILMYGPALPLVYIISVVVMLVRYWCDKAEILHMTMARGTNQYLFNTATLTVPFLVLCHCAISYFIYGNPVTSPSFNIDKFNTMYNDQVLADLDLYEPGGAFSYLIPSYEGFFTASFWNKIPGYLNSSSLAPAIIFISLTVAYVSLFVILMILMVGGNKDIMKQLNRIWPEYGYDDDIKFKQTLQNLIKERRLTSYRISENPDYASVALIMRELDQEYKGSKNKDRLIGKLINNKFKRKKQESESETESDSS